MSRYNFQLQTGSVISCLFPSLPPSLLLCSALYQIAHLGDDDDEPEFSSAMQLEEGETFFFAPRPLRNLVQVDEMESLSPIMACQVCGRGTHVCQPVMMSSAAPV